MQEWAQQATPAHIVWPSHFLVRSAKTAAFVGFGRLTGAFADVPTDRPLHRKLIRQALGSKDFDKRLDPVAFKAPSLRASP
jgi:hypothetical protein